jgi:hypothetical protein
VILVTPSTFLALFTCLQRLIGRSQRNLIQTERTNLHPVRR